MTTGYDGGHSDVITNMAHDTLLCRPSDIIVTRARLSDLFRDLVPVR
jgi:hypothetical protein